MTWGCLSGHEVWVREPPESHRSGILTLSAEDGRSRGVRRCPMMDQKDPASRCKMKCDEAAPTGD